jgi:cell wall-associated NlpC family hydrolase
MNVLATSVAPRRTTSTNSSLRSRHSRRVGAEPANRSWPLLRCGDLLLARNRAWRNPVPGYYNPVAIYDGRHVMEAQLEGNAVRRAALHEFLNRYPELVVLRHVAVDARPALAMGEHARTLVGQPYLHTEWWLPKVFSCVALIRVCYAHGFHVDPGFNLPDHIRNSGLFNLIGWK